MTELDKATKKELLAFAKKNKIKAPSTLLKKDLIALLEDKLPASALKKIKATKAKPAKKAARAKKGKAVRKSSASIKKSVKKSASAPSGDKRRTGRSEPFEKKVLSLEDAAQTAKFMVGTQDTRDESFLEVTPELPEFYGEDRLVLLPRDPYWAHLYWELKDETVASGLNRLGQTHGLCRAVLRFHKTGPGPEETCFEVDVDFRTRRYNQKIDAPGSEFYAEIGLLSEHGRFVSLAASHKVVMPVDAPSQNTDELWMTRDRQFSDLYQLSPGPDGPPLWEASQEEKDAGSWALSGSSSASAFSPMDDENKFQVEAEVVLYGFAPPQATVTLDDEVIPVRADGSFSIRLALPEGRHALPMTFKNADGKTIRQVIPVLSRKTRLPEVTP